ncbi:hypothetical protein AAFF_G00296590 [Aldrovandia affinis]|uniref:DUF5641 domain-containing protein n=1 Tax=Aldrovandia affinis TaxID=143900 RepID=A0AAD7SR43_9TELE|nr:hypothetical protein AAFF_G00296590 [Aldrovandia affinis]
MEANSTTSHDAPNTGDLTTRGQRDIADLIIMQQKLALLPAREIAVFNGDPLTYQSFIRAFEYLVEDKTSSSQDRLYFLEQYTSDQPKDLVRSCLNMDARQGYAEAKRLLKKHFGNEVMVTNAYLEKALSWTGIKADDGKALQAYALYLRGCYIAMQDLEYLKELDIPSNLMTSKLPYKLRDKWRTAAHDTMGLTYAFLDPGSSATFCTENLMKWLHAKGWKTEILLRTMGQERLVKSYGLTGLEVTNLEGTTHLNLPRVYTQDRIPVSKENIPTQNDLEKWPYLSGIQLDEIDADIDLLIGINVPKAMEPWHIINSQGNGPYAVKTLLGWVVNGPLNTCTAMDVSGPPAMMANRILIADLGELIIRQYNQDFSEREYEEKSEMSGEDKKFMEIASSSITLQDGHYHLALPLRDKDVVMPDNHDMAEQRTMNLLKRFREDVSSKNNPADDASRGLHVEPFLASRWLKGPEFLEKNEGKWPKIPEDLGEIHPDDQELKTKPIMPPGLFQKGDLYSQRRWKQVQYLADLFWRRGVREYLPLMQQRSKWNNPKRNLSPDDLVVIVDETAPRNSWLMGPVVKTLPGSKGLVRSVLVRTRTNILQRPVDKLCLLQEAVD